MTSPLEKGASIATVLVALVAASAAAQNVLESGTLPESTAHPPTSREDVLTGNPIKLTITKQAPSADLPSVSGSFGMDEAVRQGLKSNLSLQQSEKSWIISKFQARSALGRLGPSASFSTFFAESSIDQMLFFMPGEIASAPMQPITRRTSLHLIFAGTQPLFTGGRLIGGYKAARAQERQTLSGYRANRIAVALKIKEKYLEAAWNEARLRIGADYVKYRDWSSANMKARMDQGKAPRADYLRELAELSRARAELNNLYRTFNASLINLKVALGVNLASQIDLQDPLEYVDTPHDLDFYLAESGRSRPEIDEANNKVTEVRARFLVAASRYAPQISLFGLASNATGRTPGVDETVEGRWGALVGIIGGITLFDSGSRFNELRAARTAVRQAEIARQEVQLKVAQDVSLAWIDLETARRNVDLARAEVESAEEDHRLFHMRYLVGKAIALEDFDAAVKMFQSRLNLLEAIYNYRLAQARLVWASGSI